MTVTMNIDLKDLVRTIPDYPKPGIMFRDITTLLGHANGFRACVEQLAMPFVDRRVQMAAGIEERGFILGGAVADAAPVDPADIHHYLGLAAGWPASRRPITGK